MVVLLLRYEQIRTNGFTRSSVGRKSRRTRFGAYENAPDQMTVFGNFVYMDIEKKKANFIKKRKRIS